jgi:hypothetical protein
MAGRRHPACGSELEHDPHPYACDYRPDGTVLQVRDQTRLCSGWTAGEADLCKMIRQVTVTMLEHAPPDGSRAYRLECSRDIAAALHMLFLHQVDELAGAELVIVAGQPGRWQLTEVPQPLASGTVRAGLEPAAASAYPGQ